MMPLRGLCGTVVLTALAGCVASVPDAGVAERADTPLAVTNNGQPFQMWEGAAARKVADAKCSPGGVNASIYDRFDRASGAWVYPGGCA